MFCRTWDSVGLVGLPVPILSTNSVHQPLGQPKTSLQISKILHEGQYSPHWETLDLHIRPLH